MHFQPYLFFEGSCEEALEFYRTALDAEVEMLMRYQDNAGPPQTNKSPPGSVNKVMH